MSSIQEPMPDWKEKLISQLEINTFDKKCFTATKRVSPRQDVLFTKAS